MKKIMLLLSILFLFNCASQTTDYFIKTTISNPSSTMKVAIINENVDSWWVSSIAYRVLITELLDVGFKVIERSNLEKVIKEQKITETLTSKNGQADDTEESNNFTLSVLDRNTIKEIGNMLGVDYLIITYVVPKFNLKMGIATFRLVNVYSGEIMTSTTVHTPILGSDINEAMEYVAIDIMEAIKTGKNIIRNKRESINSKPSFNLNPNG